MYLSIVLIKNGIFDQLNEQEFLLRIKTNSNLFFIFYFFMKLEEKKQLQKLLDPVLKIMLLLFIMHKYQMSQACLQISSFLSTNSKKL